MVQNDPQELKKANRRNKTRHPHRRRCFQRTGWQRGGEMAWVVLDATGQPNAARGSSPGCGRMVPHGCLHGTGKRFRYSALSLWLGIAAPLLL